MAFGFMKGDAHREVQEVVPVLWVAGSRCKKRKETVDNGIFPFHILLLRYDF